VLTEVAENDEVEWVREAAARALKSNAAAPPPEEDAEKPTPTE
jgi:hypothetical protein